ncbi:MAG: hypothetical protein M0R41_14955 [Methylobacter tundripaludum]|nr:hypothetical protein [Methylobacter tundripaludum]
MNVNQEKSLQLIENLLNSMDDATFLKEYESMERNIGPTIESFIAKYCYSKFSKTTTKMECDKLLKEKHYEVKKLSHKGQNGIYPANDEVYSEQLAA